jgi:hypothetical protein
MSKSEKSIGRVVNGVYSEMTHLLSKLHRFDGKRVLIRIEEYTGKRSKQQNRYCWGVVVPTIKKHLIAHNKDLEGMTDEQVYSIMKYNYGMVWTIDLPDKRTMMLEGSGARLSTKEFEDFMESARAMAASWGCFIPMPKEIERLNYDYDGQY